jgi:hypothetical protein
MCAVHSSTPAGSACCSRSMQGHQTRYSHPRRPRLHPTALSLFPPAPPIPTALHPTALHPMARIQPPGPMGGRLTRSNGLMDPRSRRCWPRCWVSYLRRRSAIAYKPFGCCMLTHTRSVAVQLLILVEARAQMLQVLARHQTQSQSSSSSRDRKIAAHLKAVPQRQVPRWQFITAACTSCIGSADIRGHG